MHETAYTPPELTEVGDFSAETLGFGGSSWDTLWRMDW
ncbi:lasso RiPP family leader peptide-containing protein [Saccharopolyspora cebuensis]|uniref:Lasso RiPP family leader peptide-containing protein n=1 Tax=Saccharopolyspora cebuensis TaxID=418759 RepID=A0ABV4CMX9_9PSEU